MTPTEAKQRFTRTLTAMNVAAFLYKVEVAAFGDNALPYGVVRATNANGAVFIARYWGNEFTEWELELPDVGNQGEVQP